MNEKYPTMIPSEKRPVPALKRPARTRPRGPRETACNPAEFDKKTSPVRERMARDLQEMSPEERIKRGR